ncbi:hypothetical protein CC1G_07218 [Coprinopsis cinerea okayama7|uniref:Uncharacterized protein n=1 Tax=Coprinopsis cinerea (strain Okayama-7 / 130 / ATCC MYA-4618 / FGSC 9003) TaxID=240176 RepID=A8PCY7_COPC7|nr:hypothetical protein CC1G_07218 [Coprinopsis cinerea okayama7\|eukprot:XP_001840488.1 hypothetical protein CC1G_07218 [Coprinopsis cinerea okayama7\
MSSPNWTSSASSFSFSDPLSFGTQLNPDRPFDVANVIDHLGAQYGLRPEQIAELHRLYQATLALRIYERVIDMWNGNRLEARISAMFSNVPTAPTNGEQSIMNDLALRLENQYVLSDVQKSTSRRELQLLVMQPNRLCYTALATDGMRTLRMENAFTTPARVDKTSSYVRKAASSVRNGYRQDIRDSIGLGPKGGRPVALVHTVTALVNKYIRKPMDLERLNSKGYIMKTAILRRFAWENKELLQVEEDEEAAANESEDNPSPPAKRKRTARGGRIPRGQDFWGRFDSYLLEKTKTLGKDISSVGWKAETIESDLTRWPDEDDCEGEEEGVDLDPELSFTSLGSPASQATQPPTQSSLAHSSTQTTLATVQSTPAHRSTPSMTAPSAHNNSQLAHPQPQTPSVGGSLRYFTSSSPLYTPGHHSNPTPYHHAPSRAAHRAWEGQ